MAHTAQHFSLGMATATAACALPLAHAWAARHGLAAATGRWLALSYGVGLYAIIPSLRRRAGCPDSLCGAWWMDVFLFHPLVTNLKAGGTILGPALLTACFAAQYLFLLAAIRRVVRASECRLPRDSMTSVRRSG